MSDLNLPCIILFLFLSARIMEKCLFPVSFHQALIYLKPFVILLLCLVFYRFNNLSFIILFLLLTWCCFSGPLIIFFAFFQTLPDESTLVLEFSSLTCSCNWGLEDGVEVSFLKLDSLHWSCSLCIHYVAMPCCYEEADITIPRFINTASSFAACTLLWPALIMHTVEFKHIDCHHSCWTAPSHFWSFFQFMKITLSSHPVPQSV